MYDSDALRIAAATGVTIDRGGFDELLPQLAELTGASGYDRVVGEVLAFAALEMGDHDSASGLIAGFAADTPFADDYTTLFCASAATHVRTELSDAAGAAAAAAVIEPFSDRWAGLGTSPLSMGPVALALARHAAASGDPTAEALFDEAIRVSERAEAPAWLARSLVFAASFRRSTGDVRRADELANRARGLAATHQLPYVARRLGEFGPTSS